MANAVKVPDIGDYSNVEVIEVMVQVGDVIQAEQPLITLETDKAAMEIPAPNSGKITAMEVTVGDKVSQDSIILYLLDEDSALQVADTSKEQAEPAVEQTSNDTSTEQEVFIPELGIDGQVEVIEVNVKIGDTINTDEPLLTLESDKASMEVPAPFAGTVGAILVQVGDKVATKDLIAKLIVSASKQNLATSVESNSSAASKSSAAKSTTPHKSSKEPQSQALHSPADDARTAYAGPGVRRFANEMGVNIASVAASGPKGRILVDDVKEHVRQTLTTGANSTGSNNLGFNLPPASQINYADFGPITLEPLNRIKKLSGGFLHRNWLNIPHVTQFDEADISELENFRKAQKSLAEKHKIKLTPLVFLMKALVAALKEYPTFNSSLAADGEQLVLKQYFHIGVAVDTPNGLVVPVVRDVDQKGLFALASDLATLSSKAREGKLSAKDMQGGCITISSLGGIGGTMFTPIVNAPEVAILGVSKAKMSQVYLNEQFVPRLMLPLALSYDHRVIDGAQAARFITFMTNQLTDIRRLLL